MAQENSKVALVLIDVINDLEFPNGEKLLKYALAAAPKIARLRKRAEAAGVPVIYVNDNFGRWQSDFRGQVQRCLSPDVRGHQVAALLVPGEQDYFVLKPKHSAFFSTSLDILLKYLGVKRLVLAGFAGDICVLYTANDAYMRDYELVIASDCTASETIQGNRYALERMKNNLKADVRRSGGIRF